MWAKEDHLAFVPKMKGSGIIVADFIDKCNRYLVLTTQEQAENPAVAKSARA